MTIAKVWHFNVEIPKEKNYVKTNSSIHTAVKAFLRETKCSCTTQTRLYRPNKKKDRYPNEHIFLLSARKFATS